MESEDLCSNLSAVRSPELEQILFPLWDAVLQSVTRGLMLCLPRVSSSFKIAKTMPSGTPCKCLCVLFLFFFLGGEGR